MGIVGAFGRPSRRQRDSRTTYDSVGEWRRAVVELGWA